MKAGPEPSGSSAQESARLSFTGERVIPGAVSATLYTRHARRYEFAKAYCAARRVLDVGCGANYGARFVDNAAMFVAVDVDLGGLSATNGSRADAVAVAADGLALPFRSGAFDVVLCFEVIEHVVAADRLLDNIRRVLKPGGRFLLSTPNRDANSPWWPSCAHKSYLSPFHVREYTPQCLTALLSRYFPEVQLYGQWTLNLLKRRTTISAKALVGRSPVFYRFLKSRLRAHAGYRQPPVLIDGHGLVEPLRHGAVHSHEGLLAVCKR